jgi:hypothetical protein
MSRTVHPKSGFKNDAAYIRLVLQQMATYLERNDWDGVRLSFQEIGAVASVREGDAYENDLNIDGARHLMQYEIEDILLERKHNEVA